MTETAGAILLREGKLLLGRRAAHKTFPAQWDVIGGHVEAGETPWQALHRELVEELGIHAAEGEYVGTLEVEGNGDPASRLSIYIVVAWTGTPGMCGDEHSEIALVHTERGGEVTGPSLRGLYNDLRYARSPRQMQDRRPVVQAERAALVGPVCYPEAISSSILLIGMNANATELSATP